MANTVYDKKFYDDQQADSLLAARETWPVVFRYLRPKSVLDIGCGVGTWLKALETEGVTEYLGVDGDYVKKESLLIAPDRFIPFDLTKRYTAPSRFDLAISLEVGEHLPDASAQALVDGLTGAADYVLFSAALPGQMGTYHINEQWPEYWAAKFASRGFTPVDCIRKSIWHNPRIPVWYRQNMILYIKSEVLEQSENQLLIDAAASTDPEFLTRIHPELFRYYQQKMLHLGTFEGFARYKLAPLRGKK